MDKPFDNDADLPNSPPHADVGVSVAADVDPNVEGLDDSENESQRSQRSSKKRRSLVCFECNRPEGHFLVAGKRWFFSFLLGLTFGGILLIGPYKCQCCGATRLMCFDSLNPRYWLQATAHRKK